MSESKKPNIVFFFTDDQRFDTIRALGNEEISTPNIDRLVARGTSFTSAHIPSGSHGAVCMPSRAMLHTGRTLFHLEGSGERIPAEHTTLGEALREAGYETFGTGKWHNGCGSYHRSFSSGAEIFFGGMADHWNVPAYDYDPSGCYEATRPECADPMRSNAVRHRRCDHIRVGRHSSELLADAAVDFLDGHGEEKPYWLYLSFLAPHDPRTMPKRFLDMYDPAEVRLPENFMGGHSFDNGALHVRDEELAGFPRTEAEVRRHNEEYYAMISHLDEQVGRVMDRVEARGDLENTIFVFAGDNGLAVGRHGLFGKQNCYEHSVRVPLIFAGPGIPAGERRDTFVYLLDIFPTLCDLADVSVPKSVEGRSLAGAIGDGNVTVRDRLFFAFERYQRAVKDERYKLIEYVVDGRHNMTQLFDLANDPSELRNLASDPAYRERLDGMRRMLTEMRDEWNDTIPEWGGKFWRGFSG